jgi:hypothetical protein
VAINTNLIQLDNGIDSIKSARNLCHLLSISSMIFGGLIWSLTPFLATGKNPITITTRYFSLLGTASAGAICLVSAGYLRKTDAIVKASQKASENLLINQLASSQFAQQQYYQVLAKELPQILANRAIDESLMTADMRSQLTGQENVNSDDSAQSGLSLAIAPAGDTDDLDLNAVYNLALEKGELTARDLQRSPIGRKLGLNSEGAKYLLEKLADSGYGYILPSKGSIKFIPGKDT